MKGANGVLSSMTTDRCARCLATMLRRATVYTSTGLLVPADYLAKAPHL